jgi:ADP-ribose pyrophosphatase YjhB (NUDIX family)
MKFSNKENELITKESIGDRELYFSRSIAVLGVVIVRNKDDVYILVERRGTKVDEPFKWCVPCGYLDWNENGTGAIFREILEETNLNMDTFLNENKLVYERLRQPWYVSDNPHTSNRENVTLRYGCCVDVDGDLPELSNCNVGETEVTDLKWLDVTNVGGSEYDFAFGHDVIISKFIQIVLEYFGVSK